MSTLDRTRPTRLRALLLSLAAFTALPLVAPAQQEERMEHCMALERMANETGEATLDAFAAAHLSPAYVESLGRDGVRALLGEIRRTCRNPGGIMLEPTEAGARMGFDTDVGLWSIEIGFEAAAPFRIASLELSEGERPPGLPPFSWDEVEERLAELEEQGFSGAVLLVRGGEVVLDRGYGFADRPRGVRNTPDTLFAIGSTPIDFTKAGILWLWERGELALDDPLAKYFEDVPEDKAAITLEQLMTGRSGLRNFHGIRGADEDLDLSWIGRDEALRRIFGHELLFAPGEGYAHSHSAWGVLAAVIELVSGTGYEAFLREHLFTPAGMDRTGNYPHARRFDAGEVAVGEGRLALGKPSTPLEWGETSWLVMGSGGMVSTTRDLHRWLTAMQGGKLLGPESLKRYWSGGILAGGNDRGFLCVLTEGPTDLVIVCSNSHESDGDLESGLARGLAEMVLANAPAPFSIGVAIDLGAADRPRITQVVAGSAAEEAGLRAGDGVLNIDGDGTREGIGARIHAAARSGAPFSIALEREGERVEVRVEPRPRGA